MRGLTLTTDLTWTRFDTLRVRQTDYDYGEAQPTSRSSVLFDAQVYREYAQHDS
jgi:hypothetical protein